MASCRLTGNLDTIRGLLAREVAREAAGEEREDSFALLCCVQLFSRGRLEDALTLWGAKITSMDFDGVIDVQLLCGAGLAETKAYLGGSDAEGAADALEYIEECEETGDFKDFDVAAHLDWYRRYFSAEEAAG